jgi:hypothetical protein
MNLDRLWERLGGMGVKFSKPTLKRLGYEGLISHPERAKPEERTPGKKGKEVSYKEKAVAEAAAVWAIKEALGRRTLPSKTRICAIKKAADKVYDTPFPYCRIVRQGEGTPGGIGGMELEDTIEIKFVSEKFEDLSLFPGRTLTDQSNKLEELVIAWVCATEKVKHGCKSAVDPKKVVLHWHQDMKPYVTLTTPIKLKYITVEDSDHDEIVPLWNEMDVYSMMPLFIGGPDAWMRWQDSSPH